VSTRTAQRYKAALLRAETERDEACRAATAERELRGVAEIERDQAVRELDQIKADWDRAAKEDHEEEQARLRVIAALKVEMDLAHVEARLEDIQRDFLEGLEEAVAQVHVVSCADIDPCRTVGDGPAEARKEASRDDLAEGNQDKRPGQRGAGPASPTREDR
jgi:hypothetical protein